MSWRSILMVVVLFAALLGANANCQAQSLSMTAEGVLGGAVLGAGTGALVGMAMERPIKGALIGAGLGALGGGAIGYGLQQRSTAQQQLAEEVAAQQREIERQRAEIQQMSNIHQTTE